MNCLWWAPMSKQITIEEIHVYTGAYGWVEGE